MGSIAPIAKRLGKLIRMLSSSNTAEVAATAGALMRTLREAGLDVHDLAAAVESADAKMFSEAQAHEIYQRAFDDGKRSVQKPTYSPPTWREIAEDCLDAIDQLRERDADFVRSVLLRIRIGEEPSEKQAKWLKDIYRRIPASGFWHV
jgi:hypothetical protein